MNQNCMKGDGAHWGEPPVGYNSSFSGWHRQVPNLEGMTRLHRLHGSACCHLHCAADNMSAVAVGFGRLL